MNATQPPDADARAEGQWPVVARMWKRLGPPLRPSGEDLSYFRAALSEWCSRAPGKVPRGLILGVTPELFELPWPDRSALRAADRTPEMVEHVWPGSASSVLLSDWRELTLPGHSIDIAVCDGGLHLLDFPDGQSRLCDALARLIAPGGLFAIRLFVPPARKEMPRHVLDALLAGRIPDLNCLKLRLGMALQESPAAGVSLGSVWLALREAAPDWPALSTRLGWPLDHLLAIDAYRDSDARYHFVTVEEARTTFCERPGGAFTLLRTDTPSYAMGEQCPTLLFRRRAVRAAGKAHD